MRLPKTVQISGKTYNVQQDKDRWGGNGGTGKQVITVGTKNDQSVERKFENFVHEVAEMVAAEQTLRFEANDSEIVFVMTHKQFDRFASDFATAILPMVKE